ncbi:hypothetical protein BSLG_006070 [Batrachochytrium salamandrivorans]|nr:hypothetical protein BSLG_006070 [Batrachochytrium salamandrivorans]
MVQDSRLKINTSSTTKTAGGNVNGSNSGDSKYATESPTLMPIASEADIDYSLIYALHTFVANLEGQVCVLKGDSLELLDDSNSYWWLVKCIKTQETPTERLARLNGQRNIDHASAKDVDKQSKAPSMHKKPQRIQFSAAAPEIFEEYGSDDGNDARNGENNPYYKSLGRSQDSSQGSSKTKLWESYSNLDDSASAPSPRPPSSFNGGTPGKPPLTKEKLWCHREEALSTETLHLNQAQILGPNAINVLRIFAGNVNLDATFKSVAFTETMIASELVNGALKKFRVQGANPADYYISVLYMDSQSSWHWRFSKVSQSYGFRGNVSTVRITDDSLIRVLINKVAGTDRWSSPSDAHCIPRLAFTKRIYRTIGIPRETVLIPGEPLIPIMRVAEQRGQDLSFLLLRDKLVLPDIPSANNSKPSFAKQGANNMEAPSAPRKYSETGSVDTGYAQPTKFVIANPDELQKNSA